MAAFEELGLMAELSEAVQALDWQLPMDIQAEAVPLILGGGDVLMAAETGSGKTGAFCLPILQTVWETECERRSPGSKSAGADPVADGQWRMSASDRDRLLAVSADGARCQCRELSSWHGARGSLGVRGSGRWYFEARVLDEGLCRVGWASSSATRDLGTDAFGFGFGGTGKKSNQRRFDPYGRPFGQGDVIGCYLDLDCLEIRFSLNGEDLGLAFHVPESFQQGGLFPAVVLKNAEMEFIFTDSSFSFVPGHGHKALALAPASCLTTPGACSQDRSRPKNAPHALILEPSRELAEQTAAQLKLFSRKLPPPGVRHVLLVGGSSAAHQMDQLTASGGVDIVVATPGRLQEFVAGGRVSTEWCRFLVLDEADALIQQQQGATLVTRLHSSIPKVTSDGHRLQMVVCSATLHSVEVKRLADRLMYHPTWVDLKGQDSVPETVHHVAVMVDPRKDTSWRSLQRQVQTDTVHALDRVDDRSPEALSEAVKLLKAEYCVRAILQHRMEQALIFCRTKLDCDNLERYLNKLSTAPSEPGGLKNPFSCVCLHSDRSGEERRANLERFRRKEVRLLVCTDVAARGIDVSGLPFVISVTLADNSAGYVHRAGRVGRAERMGLAISLVAAVAEKVWYHRCSGRGRGCSDTRLGGQGGCCVWYDELQLLSEVEQHLGSTVDQVGPDMHVPTSQYDGVVVYGQRRGPGAALHCHSHVEQMGPSVRRLAALEHSAQSMFLHGFSRTGKTPLTTL